ncbi:MAG TPA: SDR family NAD(P)-dependent oxidoreductase, partial [Thermoanaerobaculia bacterium]|nr:SDR family NAD(P)-dependent oxidoreductase [Thermoanaerobaculia bacterium]
MRFRDRVALVTGGGSGIGAAAARAFAAEGARVAVLGRTREKLDEVVEAIQKDGGEAMTVTADVSKYAEMEEAVRQVVDRWGRLDT